MGGQGVEEWGGFRMCAKGNVSEVPGPEKC